METKYIIIIAVAAAVVVLLIGLCVFFFLKKKGNTETETDILNASKDRIAANAQTVEVLLVLARGKEKTTEELKRIQDKLKYLSPSTNEKVKEIDEKINNELGDLKIELNKKNDEDKDDRVAACLENLRLKIAERSTYTDRL